MRTLIRPVLALLIAVSALAQPTAAAVLARGVVVVGQDGNGSFSTSFPSLVEEEGFFYFYSLALQEATQMEGRRSVTLPLPESVTVTLNDEVVLAVDDFDADLPPLRVALNPPGEENRLLVTARGVPGSAARVSVVASRDDRRLGGHSVLPSAESGAGARLAIHNAGSGPVVYRVAFFDADGALAGLTAPALLGPRASAVRALDAAAPPAWQSGAVYVEWVACGPASVTVSDGATVLDRAGPDPVNRARFEEVSGGLLGASGER
jgi:hypothetical protein